jgi:hypothetical protein
VQTDACFGTSDEKFIVRCVLDMTHSVLKIVTSGNCRWVINNTLLLAVKPSMIPGV